MNMNLHERDLEDLECSEDLESLDSSELDSRSTHLDGEEAMAGYPS